MIARPDPFILLRDEDDLKCFYGRRFSVDGRHAEIRKAKPGGMTIFSDGDRNAFTDGPADLLLGRAAHPGSLPDVIGKKDHFLS